VTVVADGKQKHLKVGGIPMGITMSRDGKRVYVATRAGNTVAVIDTGNDEVVQTIPVEGEPGRLKLTPAGKHLITTQMGSGDAAVIDTATYRILRRFPAGTQPEGIEID
jgi:YVTN family beta-propeller protein